MNNVRTFNYDANFNPQTVTDSTGTLASFAFNTDGTLQSGAIGYDISSQPQKASLFTYDAYGNLASRTDALGRTTTYQYDSLGHKIQMTQPPQVAGQTGAVTNYKYDAFGNLIETDAPLGRTTKSAYDGNGNKTSDTDARGNLTKYKYDALNRLIEADFSDGTATKKSYDFRGNVVDEIDQAAHVTHHVYDLAGRETSVTRAYSTASAVTTSYTYDNDGRKLSQTDSLNHSTHYTYDAAGSLTAVSGPAGAYRFAFDDARNLLSNTDGNGNTTTYIYDARRRPVEADYPDGTKKTYGYDGPGNLVLTTDQAGNQVQYSYDGANQLQTVVELNSPTPGANTTIYGYDGGGNPIAIEDANLHTTGAAFDVLGEITQKTLPDGTTQPESRAYDQSGNLVSLTHFNDLSTIYAYDTLNRLVSRTTPGEAAVSFTYTATGKYATSTDASGTTTYSYDSMDRLTSKATPEGTLNYSYDAAGHVASIASSNPNGASVSYTYDNLNRLKSVIDNRLSTGANMTTYAYDNANNIVNVTYPNGVTTVYAYDQLNRLTGLSSAQAGPYVYQLDSTGKKTNALESGNRSVTWNYDGTNRLIGETIANASSGKNGSVTYDLDPVGNRLSENSSLSGIPSGSWSFNSDDELSSESYDANGNVNLAAGKSYAYDSENHLVSMNGGAVRIVYDAFGNRVGKTANGITTRYLVEDDLNPTGLPQVLDEIVGGVVTRTYTYGLNRISEDQVVNNTWTTSFYGYDGAGNVRQLTDPSGAITDSYEYDAFGNEFKLSGTTPNSYLYRGEQYDSDLGLYYLRARYYNPLSGRFLSRDPEDGFFDEPATLHKYLYAAGDPVNGLDPTGREDLLEYKLLRKIIAGAGLQAHHLIEKRFLYLFDFAACELAVALTPADHQVITNLWRAAIPYGPNGTGCATIAQVLSTAQAIYTDEVYAAILVSLGLD
jgi:RHS repeat-associated protein